MEDKEKKFIQKAIDKLVSDEWFAGQTYKQFILLMDAESRRAVSELFNDIAVDELDDHYKSLVDFAVANGFTVPTTYSEMKKLADKEDVKLFENGKRDQSTDYYLKKGIEAEKRAIEEYEKYIDAEELNEVPELQMVVRNNYYDEQDHLEKLEFSKDSLEALEKYN